jgi:hypothetical protein
MRSPFVMSGSHHADQPPGWAPPAAQQEATVWLRAGLLFLLGVVRCGVTLLGRRAAARAHD